MLCLPVNAVWWMKKKSVLLNKDMIVQKKKEFWRDISPIGQKPGSVFGTGEGQVSLQTGSSDSAKDK